MFRLSLKSLALFFHQIGVMIAAGVPLVRTLKTMARTCRGRLQRIATRLVEAIEQGEDLTTAMAREGSAFPRMSLTLVEVGERTGNLESCCEGISAYYQRMRQIVRRFIGRITPPLLQYLAAVAILGGVKWIAQSFISGSPLAASSGFYDTPAGILILGWGAIPMLLVVYMLVTRLIGGARVVHEVILHLPVLSKLMRHFSLGRFYWAMSFGWRAGMGVIECVQLGLRASGNAAFEARSERVLPVLEEGVRLGEALSLSGLIPTMDMEMIAVGEESGNLDDTFARLADQHFEDGDLAAEIFAKFLSMFVWAVVAVFIIINIFKFASMYVGGLTGK